MWAHEDEDSATRDETDLKLRPDIQVTSDTPPTFLLQAEDDHTDGVEQSLAYYVALQKAGVPAEMHLYAEGGHAFGLRATKLPIGRWPGAGGGVAADGGDGWPATLVELYCQDIELTRLFLPVGSALQAMAMDFTGLHIFRKFLALPI